MKNLIKITVCLIVSFVLSSFIFQGMSFEEKPVLTAEKIGTIVSILRKRINATAGLVIGSLKIKPFGLALPQITETNNFHNQGTNYITGGGKTIEPTVNSPIPTARDLTIYPTQITPTKKPKPAKIPIPSPKPITSDVRPGSSVEDIYIDIAKRLCVPAALIKSIQLEETGSKMTNYIQGKFTFFNTYGWWNSSKVIQQDICGAFAYGAQSGLVPADSKFAGVSCAKAIQPGAYDQIIMGLLQISQQEQDLSFKNTSKIITTGKIDRRVLYDNVLIFASVTINKVGSLADTGCGNWSFKAIARAACKHFGKCNYNYGANSGDYCAKICNHYNEFAGTNYDCAKASSLMVNNGDDGQCTLK